MIELLRLNDSLTLSASSALNSGEINFCAGSPGEILSNIKMNVVIKKRTINDVAIRLNISLAKSLFMLDLKHRLDWLKNLNLK
jgi:hypothetical protein